MKRVFRAFLSQAATQHSVLRDGNRNFFAHHAFFTIKSTIRRIIV